MNVIEAAARTARTRERLYEELWQVVFERHTRPLELSRQHWACARGIGHMEPDCHDAFQDACLAVVQDALAHGGHVPLDELARWIVPRIMPIVVDDHRRRRGARGALTRPRLPQWLGDALNGDPWLTKLAINILNWVGVPATANGELWPLDAWAAQRALLRGDGPGEDTVAADVHTVLAAMRTRPEWHDKYVEKPLGRKTPPVVPHPDAGSPLLADPGADAALLSLAESALDALTTRIAGGEDPRAAVQDVLATVFTSAGPASAVGLEAEYAQRVEALLADTATRQRMVDAVLDVISPQRDRDPAPAPVSLAAYRRAGAVVAGQPDRDGTVEVAPVPGISTAAEFIGQLVELRERAGHKPLRWFQQQNPKLLARTTVHYLLEERSTLPRWELAEAFIKACGVHEPEHLGAWRAAYDQVATTASHQRRRTSGSAARLADLA